MDIQELEITASLAMLELDEQEMASLSEAVSGMLEHFSLMQKVDVEGVEPTTHSYLLTEGRKDEVEQKVDRESLLSVAPEHDGEHFIIPKVL